jgi:hypothetical protein
MIDSPPSAEGTTAPPGWYPDPEAADMLRWWDGGAWSESDFKLAPRHARTAAVSLLALDAPPPPPDTGVAGWHPDPETPGVLRWWDGDAWSESDVRPEGESGYPWWHPTGLSERFGPFTRAGSLFNVAVCTLIVIANLSILGTPYDPIRIVPLVLLETTFVVLAIRAWWPR